MLNVTRNGSSSCVIARGIVSCRLHPFNLLSFNPLHHAHCSHGSSQRLPAPTGRHRTCGCAGCTSAPVAGWVPSSSFCNGASPVLRVSRTSRSQLSRSGATDSPGCKVPAARTGSSGLATACIVARHAGLRVVVLTMSWGLCTFFRAHCSR